MFKVFTPHYQQPFTSSDICPSNPLSLLVENVEQAVLWPAWAAEHHRGDLTGHHVGELQGGGGAGLRLGRQEHRAVYPQEAGGLLSKGLSYIHASWVLFNAMRVESRKYCLGSEYCPVFLFFFLFYLKQELLSKIVLILIYSTNKMYYNYWSSKCICKYLKKWINVDDLFLYYIFVEYIFIEWEQFYLITDLF